MAEPKDWKPHNRYPPYAPKQAPTAPDLPAERSAPNYHLPSGRAKRSATTPQNNRPPKRTRCKELRPD